MQSETKLGRRPFLHGAISSCGLILSGCVTTAHTTNKSVNRKTAAIYKALPREKFPIPAADVSRLDPKFYRTVVEAPAGIPAGTIFVDIKHFHLYYIAPDSRTIRYGVGLGRAGFEWSGRGYIAWKRKWPTWTPPATMIARQPELAKYSAKNGGMAPGLKNPLGAAALYIFEGKKDTLYRLHGTPQIASIGKAVSSGCVRMINQDALDLYRRVPSGTPIIVG